MNLQPMVEKKSVSPEKIKKVEVIIEEYKDELIEVYDKAFNRADYSKNQAGMIKMFAFFNTLIPTTFRKGLSFSQCELLNREICEKLAKMVSNP